jgi:hypothetical protein
MGLTLHPPVHRTDLPVSSCAFRALRSPKIGAINLDQLAGDDSSGRFWLDAAGAI